MTRSGLRALSILLPLIAVLTGCTPNPKQTAQVQIQFPQSRSKTYSSVQVSTAAGWGIADPSSNEQIVCYAIAVSGPDLSSATRECHDVSGKTVMQPGILVGTFPVSTSASIDVPAGAERTIYVIGFAATSASACKQFSETTGPDRSALSAPFIVGKVTTSLVPGQNDIAIPVTLTGSVKFDDCSGLGQSSPPPTSTPVGSAPSNLTYSTATPTYFQGTAIASNTPSNSGGAITNYSVSPSLPSGLTLNSSTGVISGTPTVVAGQFSYLVTGSNQYGSTSTSIQITVRNAFNPYVTSSSVSQSGSPMTAPYSVNVGDTVTLSVAASDPNSLPLEYRFYILRGCSGAGDAQSWSSSNTATYTFVASDATNCTSIIVGVRNNDGTDFDSTMFGDLQYAIPFTVSDGTTPPTVLSVSVDNSGTPMTAPYSVNVGDTVTLNVSASDPNSLPLEYRFYLMRGCSGVGDVQTWSSSNTATYTFSASDATNCTSIVVGVRNNDGTDADSILFGDLQYSVQFNVSNGTMPPTVLSASVTNSGVPLSSPYSVTVGDTVTLDVSASDPNSLPLEYSYSLVRGCSGAGAVQTWSSLSTATYTFVAADVTACTSIIAGVRNNDGTDADSPMFGDLQYSFQFNVSP